jgi:hypothetical protein
VTDAAQDEEPLAQAAVGPVIPALVAGLRQPIVWILLLIAFFTAISGKPLDGVLMLTVAALLSWDAARSARWSERTPAPTGAPSAQTPRAGTPRAQAPGTETPRAGTPRAGARRLASLGLVTAGLVYADVVGGFRRYSWPVTISVVALGCLLVAVGWQGPLRERATLTAVAARRMWMWAVVLVAGGLWELNSLLQQPHLSTDSYAHPTISALTDPVLASHPGRSLVLGAWLLLGWALAGR